MQPVTLITGASSGIGAGLAREFARHGHATVLTARRESELSALANEIASAGHAKPHVIITDLTQADAPARLADELTARDLEPSVVVNNAGFGLLGLAADLDRARQRQMIDLNARALTDLSLRFLPSMKRHGGGVLNVASVAGFFPGPRLAVYHASKAFVVSLSEALHQELKPHGVRVTVLCPGPVETEFMSRAGIPQGYFPRILARSVERVAREGYEAFARGDRVVIPGFANKAMTLLARFAPRDAVLAVSARMVGS